MVLSIKRIILSLLIFASLLNTTIVCYADTSANTDNIKEQAMLINSVIHELSAIRELIIIQRQMRENEVNLNKNIGNLLSQQEMMASIIQEMKTLNISIKEYKEEKQAKEKISQNTLSIMQQTEKIQMLIRELKLMNMIVFAKTDTLQVDVELDKIFNLIITAKNITSGTTSFTVTYDSNQIEVVDLCNITLENDLTTPITVGDVTVSVHNIEQGIGTITLTMDKQLSQEQAWSGIVNGIKFKGKKACQTTININND